MYEVDELKYLVARSGGDIDRQFRVIIVFFLCVYSMHGGFIVVNVKIK